MTCNSGKNIPVFTVRRIIAHSGFKLAVVGFAVSNTHRGVDDVFKGMPCLDFSYEDNMFNVLREVLKLY